MSQNLNIAKATSEIACLYFILAEALLQIAGFLRCKFLRCKRVHIEKRIKRVFIDVLSASTQRQ